MIVGRITMAFESGRVRNQAKDLGLDNEPSETVDGREVCGLGTHFLSPEAKEKAKRCQEEYGRINRAVSREFMRSPIPGLYVLPSKEAGGLFLQSLDPSPEVNARCVVYDLSPGEKLPEKELGEWADTIRQQFVNAPLGRKKEASQEGLEIVEKLVQCPVLADETREEILRLVAAARIEQIDRSEFKRRIAEVSIQIDDSPEKGITAPRRPRVSNPDPETSFV